VASLERTHGARARWSTLLSVLLMAGAVLSVPLVGATLGAGAVGWVNLVWLFFVLTAFSRTVARVNREEVACDARAVELCGDPEAFIRALAKLHALSKLPTRWDSEFEKSMSHPGLASRIEAIRRAAGLATPAFDEEVVLASSEPGRYAILGPEQVGFLEGVTEGDLDPAGLRQRAASCQVYAYRSLAELEVKVRIGGAATLDATTFEGKRLRLPLAPASVAPAQKALDAADAKLGRRTAETAPLAALAALAALVLIAGSFAPGMAGAIAVPALLVLFRQQVAPVLAAGTMAVAASLLAMATADSSRSQSWTVIGLPLVLVLGLYLLSLARRLARARPASTWRDFGAAVTVLALGSAVALPVALDDLLTMGWHLGSTRQTTGPLFALSLAVLLVARRWRRRTMAAPPAAQ
jgi:hypothetical protein